MIAIDTNVLLRYLLEDDADQAALAARLMTGHEPVLITDAVLVETIWTLRGGKYRFAKPAIVSVVQALFKEANIRFEDARSVWRALHDYRKARRTDERQPDFSDALIARKAERVTRHAGASFGGFYTFDKAAQTLPGAKALV